MPARVSRKRKGIFALACLGLTPIALVLVAWTPLGVVLVLAAAAKLAADYRSGALPRTFQLIVPAALACVPITVWTCAQDNATALEFVLLGVASLALVTSLTFFEPLV